MSHPVKKSRKGKTNEYSLITQFIVNCISWIVLIPSIVICLVYRTFLDIILMIKVGTKYGGLLDRADMTFLAPDPSKFIVTNVLYIKSKEKVDLLGTVRDILEEKVFRHPDHYLKLTSRVQQFGGYCWWLKNEIEVSDVIMPLTPAEGSKVTEEYVRDFAAKISNADFFKDGLCWDLHITTEPIEDNVKDGFFRYVVVPRVHHCIGDGTSLMALFIKMVGDESAQNYSVEVFNKLMKPKPTTNDRSVIQRARKLMMNIMQSVCFWLDLIFLAMGRAMIQLFLVSNDNNPLHGNYRNYSTEKVVAWTTEDNPECIALVKKIKSKTNTQFAWVLGTAVVDTLSRYFTKHSREIPKHISGMMTVLLALPKIDPSKPVKLLNKTSGVLYRFPTIHQSDSLIDALKSNCDMMKYRKKFTEVLMFRFIVGYVFGSVPSFLMLPFMGITKQTMIITNVPGGSQVKLFNGCVAEKVVPLIPNTKSVGLSIAILTYDDKFQVGILVDKSLQKSQEEVQTISDGILDSIRRLHEECRMKGCYETV